MVFDKLVILSVRFITLGNQHFSIKLYFPSTSLPCHHLADVKQIVKIIIYTINILRNVFMDFFPNNTIAQS